MLEWSLHVGLKRSTSIPNRLWVTRPCSVMFCPFLGPLRFEQRRLNRSVGSVDIPSALHVERLLLLHLPDLETKELEPLRSSRRGPAVEDHADHVVFWKNSTKLSPSSESKPWFLVEFPIFAAHSGSFSLKPNSAQSIWRRS